MFPSFFGEAWNFFGPWTWNSCVVECISDRKTIEPNTSLLQTVSTISTEVHCLNIGLVLLRCYIFVGI